MEYSIGDIRKMKTSKRETETNERHKKKKENKLIEYKMLLITRLDSPAISALG